MKLPFGSGNSKPARGGVTSAESASSAKSFSLRSQRVLLLVTGALVVAIAPIVVYLQGVATLRDGEQQRAELAAGLFASGYRQWVAQQGATADLVVKDPQLGRLMEQNEAAALEHKAASLAYLFPTAVRVRLLPPGIEETDPNANPPISYAALDMLRHAETQDTPPPVEVHMSGTPQQHVTLVRRILDASGRRLVGDLMVSYPIRMLQDLLGQEGAEGYVEWQQVSGATPLVLGSHGDAGFKHGEPDSQVSVGASRWRVAYWAADTATATGGLLNATLLASALAMVLLLVVVWMVFGRIGSALKRDQATLLTVVKDARSGRGKLGYASALTEMSDTIELLARLAVSGASRATAPDREPTAPAASAAPPAAAPPAAPPIEDEIEGDLLFDDSALEIGQVDVAPNKIDARMFRAYDIRGVVEQSLTPEVAFEIGRAIGSEAYFRGEQTVVVGRDGRLSGPELTQALIKGLLATGRDVKDIGEVPTPVLYFAAQYLGSQSGVMVTGSHNPPDYNGFKIVLGGETLANEAIDSLRLRIESGDMLSGEGSLETLDVLADYIERVKSDVQIARPLKVVVDCGNGVAGAAAPQLFSALGCEVSELFCEVDGHFPNHHPDPSKAANLTALIQKVQEQGADLGVAFDGDGDRLGVVSSQGEIIWPDRVLMLLAVDVLSRHPGAQIIYDVKCSRHVATVVTEHGGEPLMWATGHSLIKAKMKETGALLAGEMSGHIFFKERWFGFDDALYSAARLLEILANEVRSSSDLFASLPDSMSTPELNVPMAEGEPPLFMEKLLNAAHFDNARVATIDGLRVEFERGWGLVRASNTTPCLVLRFEAEDELALSAIQDEFRRVMLQVDPNLSLPF